MNVGDASLEKYADPSFGGRYNIHRKSKPRDLRRPILVLFRMQFSKLVYNELK